VWVDDEHFDIGYHVRRSALPRPGSLDQLRELVSRIVSRPLDRTRPLWEMYVVEGLADGQVALLSKSHQVLVDGIETVDLGQVLLDKSPEPKELGADGWRARGRQSPFSLMAGAVRDSLTAPDTIADTVRSRTGSVLRGVATTARSAGQVADALANRTPRPGSPIVGPLSQQRRVVVVRTELADYRKVREAHGGTVNDVVLATVTGALRAWLMTRGESMRGIRQIRAMVPISVIDDGLEATALGSQIAAHFVDLPVWEASPVVRLHQVSYSFQAHKETGRAVAASRLTSISGFAPATFHAIGSRVAAVERRRGFHLSVTNVPGPQAPLYASGARMVATYPVPPLLEGHPLAIGVTSYDGYVYYGLTADRDLLPDADLLGPCVREALDELLDSATGARPRAPRGRKRPSRQKPSRQKPSRQPSRQPSRTEPS
jgi:diacylglycerol O-acyltransferase